MRQEEIENRAIRVAERLLETKGTIRSVAEEMGVSRTTVHTDLTRVLPDINPELHKEVQKLIKENTEARYSRGGRALQKLKKSIKKKEKIDD